VRARHDYSIHRKRGKALGVPELVAIALGGMVGGGIFTVLGVAVAMIGVLTPLAIVLGGLVAALAAYAYIKLGVYYRDEGATYSFYKRTYPQNPFAASLIGWWVIFGYVSTLALYAYTFSAYAMSGSAFAGSVPARKVVAGLVIAVFTLINVWSVKGMGRLEDLMVYTKLVILAVISFTLINHSSATLPALLAQTSDRSVLSVMIVAAVTFVAYEGFQLVVNAVNEMQDPARNIPRAIYTAIFMALLIYVVIALGAILAIPFADIIRNKEYALAAGANQVLGHWGTDLVIVGALLATSSAISGTVFGASRQMAVIAHDGYLPGFLARRRGSIPVNAILTMSGLAFLLILAGSLQVILEFGSVTFLLVSLLMALANHRIRDRTQSSAIVTTAAVAALGFCTLLICYHEIVHQIEQMAFIAGLYAALTLGAFAYRRGARSRALSEN
jgi:amino acid transporter